MPVPVTENDAASLSVNGRVNATERPRGPGAGRGRAQWHAQCACIRMRPRRPLRLAPGDALRLRKGPKPPGSPASVPPTRPPPREPGGVGSPTRTQLEAKLGISFWPAGSLGTGRRRIPDSDASQTWHFVLARSVVASEPGRAPDRAARCRDRESVTVTRTRPTGGPGKSGVGPLALPEPRVDRRVPGHLRWTARCLIAPYE